MGADLVRYYITERDTTPDMVTPPQNDPLFGFQERKERVCVASREQMDMAMLPLEQRDYCAHYLIKLMKCKRDHYPNLLACGREKHDWDYCEHKDYVMRMKEFERERRLNLRNKRIAEKAEMAEKAQKTQKAQEA